LAAPIGSFLLGIALYDQGALFQIHTLYIANFLNILAVIWIFLNIFFSPKKKKSSPKSLQTFCIYLQKNPSAERKKKSPPIWQQQLFSD